MKTTKTKPSYYLFVSAIILIFVMLGSQMTHAQTDKLTHFSQTVYNGYAESADLTMIKKVYDKETKSYMYAAKVPEYYTESLFKMSVDNTYGDLKTLKAWHYTEEGYLSKEAYAILNENKEAFLFFVYLETENLAIITINIHAISN